MTDFTDTKIFGVLILIVSTLLVYVFTGIYAYNLINPIGFFDYVIFISLWIIFSLFVRLVLTIIYKKVHRISSLESIKNELDGVNRRAHWGGKLSVFPTSKELNKHYKNLKKRQKYLNTLDSNDTKVSNEIKEIESRLNSIPKSAITGGSAFEGFFCIKKMLKILKK